MDQIWFVYLLRCKDDTLYCGITPDLEKRLEQLEVLRSAGLLDDTEYRSRREQILSMR